MSLSDNAPAKGQRGRRPSFQEPTEPLVLQLPFRIIQKLKIRAATESMPKNPVTPAVLIARLIDASEYAS